MMVRPRRGQYNFCSSIHDNPYFKLIELKITHTAGHPPQTTMLMLIHLDPEFDEGHASLAGTIVL